MLVDNNESVYLSIEDYCKVGGNGYTTVIGLYNY